VLVRRHVGDRREERPHVRSHVIVELAAANIRGHRIDHDHCSVLQLFDQVLECVEVGDQAEVLVLAAGNASALDDVNLGQISPGGGKARADRVSRRVQR
jgi:hypothetical protein